MKKKLTILLSAIALLSAFCLGASASTTIQEIKAQLNRGITITLDGEPQVFKDAKGNEVYPITYNGSTYLPVRAVAGVAGLDVEWDQATQTVRLGKQPNGTDLIDTYKCYHVSGRMVQYQTGDHYPDDITNISGLTRSHFLAIGANLEGGGGSISFNLQNRHDTLTFSYYADHNATLKVSGDDGLILGEYTINEGELAKTVTIPLFKTGELKFEASMRGPGGRFYIFDAYLDAE